MAGESLDPTLALLRVFAAVWLYYPATLGDDWEDAANSALAAVGSGGSAVALARELLDTLGDPSTGVVHEPEPPPDRTVAPAEGEPIAGSVAGVLDGVTVVSGPEAAAVDSTNELAEVIERTFAEVDLSGSVVLDLRGIGPHAVHRFAQQLAAGIKHDLVLPEVRAVTYTNFDADRSWLVRPAVRYPANGSAAPASVRVVIDADTAALRLAQALRTACAATLVQHGPIAACPTPPLRIPLGDGHVARIRTSDLLVDGRALRFEPDLVVAADDDPIAADRADPAPVARPAAHPRASADPRWTMLARLNATISARFAYHHLLDEPWEAAVARCAEHLRAADTEADVELTLARALVGLHDGHALLLGPAVRRQLGTTRPDIVIADLDGDYVVTHAGPGVVGLRPGDAILAVDSVPVDQLRARIEEITPSSTPQGRAQRVCSHLTAGEPDSVAELAVADPDGTTRDVRLARTVRGPVHPVSRQLVVAELPNRIGYVDLGRLAPREVAAAFAAVAGTRAVVFDLRRYPRSTGMLVAARLADRPVVGAQMRCPLPTGPLDDSSPWWHNTVRDSHIEQIVHPIRPRYTGPVVALVDAGTISQGEHTALFLEAAGSATFVGSPTNGTNGNVASVELGDGLTALYSGLDVRHGDGRQLQRVGVIPDVLAGPTRQGLAAGIDEVLEAAMRRLT